MLETTNLSVLLEVILRTRSKRGDRNREVIAIGQGQGEIKIEE